MSLLIAIGIRIPFMKFVPGSGGGGGGGSFSFPLLYTGY